jgi:hypothetical protein
MFSVDEHVLIISLYCVGFHPFELDIVVIVVRGMSPAIRENVSCEIDYGVSLSLVVMNICLLYFLYYIFHYGKMEPWKRREFRNHVLVKRKEKRSFRAVTVEL